MWQSFKDWVRASGRGSVAVVIGVLSGLLGLAQQTGLIPSDFVVPLWVWYLAAAIGLLIGSFAAFHRMRVERDTFRDELRQSQQRLPTPDLQGEILQIISGTESESATTGIMLELEIRNLGSMPTIVRHWSVTCILPDGRTIQPALMHKENIEFVMEGGRTGRYSKANLIYEKTAIAPIAIGGGQAGVLLARTADVKPPELAGAILRVTCQDVKGRSYSFEITCTGAASSPRYYPGV